MNSRFAILVMLFSGALGFSQTKTNSSLAHYQRGEKFFEERNWQEAANEFREALSGDLEPRWIVVWSHINLAKIFEVSNQSDRALNEYRLARRMNDTPRGALDDAAHYLATRSTPLPPVAYRIPEARTAPQRIQIPEAEYSQEGRVAGIEGTVLVAGVIGEDGSVHDPQLAAGLGFGLDEIAFQKVKEWRFAPGTYQAGLKTDFAVEFLLPAKQSRWHLVRAGFHLPGQTFRPMFLSAKYPLGAGVGLSALDEAGILAAVGRFAVATLSFDVDEQGIPVHFNVDAASLDVWGPQAIALVSEWRFTPGMKNGIPVSVPCTMELIWGQRQLTSNVLAQLNSSSDAGPNPPGVSQPLILFRPKPSYSEEALRAGWEGTVMISLVIGEDGVPRRVDVVRPLGFGLDDKAIEAVNQWRFQPTLLNGQPVSVPTLVGVDFRLPK